MLSVMVISPPHDGVWNVSLFPMLKITFFPFHFEHKSVEPSISNVYHCRSDFSYTERTLFNNLKIVSKWKNSTVPQIIYSDVEQDTIVCSQSQALHSCICCSPRKICLSLPLYFDSKINFMKRKLNILMTC